MTGKMIIIHLLDSHADTMRWWITDENFKQQTPPSEVLFDNKNIPIEKHRVIVFIPTKEVLLTTITLPPTSSSLRTQAALYALEDQLAEDVQALHAITVGNKSDKKLTVAVVKKTLMSEWQKFLQRFSGQQVTLLPDVFLVPWHNNAWQMITMGDMALIRTGRMQGFAAETLNLPSLIKLHKLSIEEITTNRYEDIIKQLSHLPELNLLQGEYRLSQSLNALRTLWRWPLLLTSLWLIVLIGSFTTKYIYLSYQDAKLNGEITSLYKQVYPNATSLVSPKERIDGELNQLGQSTSSSGFLSVLAMVGNTLSSYPDIKIKDLDFDHNQLSINITASDFKLIEQFSRQLQQMNLTVKQNTATRENEKVLANIVISKGA